MPSGGARLRSGPAKDPTALRRVRDAKEWVKLSRDARAGKPTPPWPLDAPIAVQTHIEWLAEHVDELRSQWAAAEDGRTANALAKKLEKASENLKIAEAIEGKREEREHKLWAELWAYPQAAVWDADFQHLNVAVYVRLFLEASQPGAKSADRTTLRQYADMLMLTEPSLHAHKYVIDAEIDGASDPDLVAEKAGLNPADESSTPSKPRRGRTSRFTVVPDPPKDDDAS